MTIRTLSITTALAAALALTACSKKSDDKGSSGSPKVGESGGKDKGKAKGGALDAIKPKLEAAKTKDDIDEVFNDCMSAMIDMGLSGIKEPDKDPAYQETCEVGLARKRAEIVIATSTPDNMSVMCISASMKLEELAEAGGPAAEEMKKLQGEVDKACGM